jgi:hypothetical protein
MMQYLILAGANLATDYDTTSYNALIAAQGANGRVVSGIIDQEGWTHAQVVEQFMMGFSFQLFNGATGTLKFADYKVEAVVGGEDTYNDQDDVLENSLAIFQNQDVINSSTVHYSWNSVEGRFNQDPQPLENLTSKTNLGSTFAEDLPLYLVSDRNTAILAASNRMYYSDEDRYQVRFQISAPASGANLDLCSNLLLTHFAGLNTNRQTSPPTHTYGFHDELLRVSQLDYELNGTPRINVVTLTMDPGENAYDFGSLPANVVFGAVTESAVGVVTVTWTLAGGATDPTWVNVYYRRTTDKMSKKRFSERVLASALTHSFTPDYDTSAAIDVYLVPEDVHGVIRELKWMIDTAKDGLLAEDIDLTEPAWDVTSLTFCSDNDYLICGYEIVRRLSATGSTITLYNDAGVRINYEDTVVATHANGTALGVITPTVAFGQDTARTKCSAIADFDGVITGLSIVFTWTAFAPASNDLAMFHHYDVYWSLTNSFTTAVKANTSDIIGTTWTDSVFSSAGPFYYWVVSVTRSGVVSTESNAEGPFNMGRQFSSVACAASGPTFTATLGLPTGVLMDDVLYITQAYGPDVWDPPTYDPDHIGGHACTVVPGITSLQFNGDDPEKTYYFAWKLTFKVGDISWDGAWTYLTSLGFYAAVTSGTDFKLNSATNTFGKVGDAGNSITYNQSTNSLVGPWSGPGATFNYDAFTASGGETYIQLAALADLSKALIVAFAALGGSMSILRLTTHFTVSNASGYTRIVILNPDSSPYTFVAGDIADIWSVSL